MRLASMIPEGARVIEFGAGNRTLRQYLPAGCSYTPTDLVAREPGMISCDLNAATLPDLPDADVAVFSGVLEFVNNIPGLLSRMNNDYGYVVASYIPAPDRSLRQRLARRRKGIVNDLSNEELMCVFLRNGFICDVTERWYKQNLYRFRKQCIQPAFVRD